MNSLQKFALAAGLTAASVLGAPAAMAQSTDGYHTIQVFPVVVDTASFTQRFTFRNPNSTAVTIGFNYFPGTGTALGSPVNCGAYAVAANSDRTFASLRSICLGLPAGSHFGFLHSYELNPTNLPYSGFSRVANPQGNGFSVEAFPAHTFTSADSVVAGVRRLAASGGNPAFQTNCFIGNLNDLTPPGSPVTTTISVAVYNSAGTQVGSTTNYNLQPGQFVRLLDVFAAVGAPAGDYDNARVLFFEGGTGEPAVMSFCTVQDNTSFGADFRIAKQEASGGGLSFSDPAQDDHVLRNSSISTDIAIPGSTTRAFTIPAAVVNNAHLMYFRHPDWIQCEVIDPSTGVRALPAYGLEMRLSRDGTIIAGGNELQGFGEIYLGDKTDFNDGANGRYVLEVESTATNTAAIRPYRIHCQSGSGHSAGEILIFNGTDRF